MRTPWARDQSVTRPALSASTRQLAFSIAAPPPGSDSASSGSGERAGPGASR